MPGLPAPGEVDRWGYAPGLAAALDRAVAAAAPVAVRGARHVPARGPTVVVLARGLHPGAPVAAAVALRRSTGRPARFLGLLDVAPVGPALRRVGGAVAHPGELAALLRAGHLVVLPLGLALRPGAAPLDEDDLVPAADLGATVVPAALVGAGWRRAWRLELAAPVPNRAGPSALAEAVGGGIAALRAR